MNIVKKKKKLMFLWIQKHVLEHEILMPVIGIWKVLNTHAQNWWTCYFTLSILGWVKNFWTEPEMEANSKNGKESIYIVASAPDQNIGTPCILYSACKHICAHRHTNSINRRVILGFWRDHATTCKYFLC